MIIVDNALREREEAGEAIRVGMVGAGFMGHGIARQIIDSTPGMDLVVIANRTIENARSAFTEVGVDEPKEVRKTGELEAVIDAGQHAITTDHTLTCRADGVDVVLDVTGTVEFGASVALEAIEHGKHVVLMNAELDATVGPILKRKADRAGVVYTNADGDQPGVTLNLYRFVKGIGVKPVLCGNIKGLHDPHRTPTTQRSFAEKWGQRPSMVTSFADGSKIAFEQAVVANATGMGVSERGMRGPQVPDGTPVERATEWYPTDVLNTERGVVDYVVGASPAPGVFVIGKHTDSVQQHYLRLYKLGTGPFYVFYRPYHLCHFEVPTTVARAVDFGDATVAPRGGPRVEVIAVAKRDLSAGERIDGIGEYMTYGEAENAREARRQDLLPMGLAKGCRLQSPVAADTALTFDDVEFPEGRVCDGLWREQAEAFSLGPQTASTIAFS